MEPAIRVILFGLLLMSLFSIADNLNKEMGNVVNLPLNAVIVKGELGSERSEDNVNKLVENINTVWNEANISFEVKDVKSVEMSSAEIITAMENGRIFAGVDGYDINAINMFFIKNMSFNGISFPQYRIVVMPDRTTNREHVAAAHELGHVLGLDHNPSEEYLMFSVCNGTAKTLAEVLSARKNAEGLLADFNSYMMLSPVSTEFTVIS